jgi:hypothetical protein
VVPVFPVTPVGPVHPVAPVFVAVPATPSGPVHPVGPVVPVTPVGPTDNRVRLAVVPARIVSEVSPSIRALILSPATKSRINITEIVVGVVTIVWGWIQTDVPFFRI